MHTPWKESYDQPRQHIKKQRHYLVNKGPSSQGYGFSNSHVWMCELDYKESWVQKNWCFWTMVEMTLESPSDCKEIQPVHSKGNQSWIFFGRTGVEAETPKVLPPDAKNWLIWKDPDWRQEEKRTTGDEIVGWHHWLNGHKLREAWRATVHGVAKSQTRLSDRATELNWTDVNETRIVPVKRSSGVVAGNDRRIWLV